MKIAVTGATGFIGNYIITELLKYNFDVVACGIESEKELSFEWMKKVKYKKCDLNENHKNWYSFFEKPDLLLHLSWQGLPNYGELFHIERNLPKNYLFLKNMIENGLENIVVSGTCFEYGKKSGVLREDLETKPNNSYGLAKDCLRRALEELQKKFDFNLKWIRLFYIYGGRQNPNSILSQLRLALEKGDKTFNMSFGEQLRDYLPVERLAEYFVKISIQNKINGIINCCSGKPISIRQLVENYLFQNKKHIELNFGYYPYRDIEPMAFWGDNGKLNEILSDFHG